MTFEKHCILFYLHFTQCPSILELGLLEEEYCVIYKASIDVGLVYNEQLSKSYQNTGGKMNLFLHCNSYTKVIQYQQKDTKDKRQRMAENLLNLTDLPL